jgi:hypothetical protein
VTRSVIPVKAGIQHKIREYSHAECFFVFTGYRVSPV